MDVTDVSCVVEDVLEIPPINKEEELELELSNASDEEEDPYEEEEIE